MSEGSTNGNGRILAFMNEVAGGRKLLEAVRARVDAGATEIAVVAPQNQPSKGQIVNEDEIRNAALSRVEVTQAVLAAFGIDSTGSVMDPDPPLALDDAIRAFDPDEVLLSCLYDSRFGLTRKDLVEWAVDHFEVPIEHIPVRVDDDAVRWDVTHTLVVATRTVASADLVNRLKERAADEPHRYTFVSPSSGDISREDVCDKLANTLSHLYAEGIDATGQPMSPEPFAAVQNAIEHYRVDDILIATFGGAESQWLKDGLIERVAEITDKPIEHVEVSGEDIKPIAVQGGGESKQAPPVAEPEKTFEQDDAPALAGSIDADDDAEDGAGGDPGTSQEAPEQVAADSEPDPEDPEQTPSPAEDEPAAEAPEDEPAAEASEDEPAAEAASSDAGDSGDVPDDPGEAIPGMAAEQDSTPGEEE